MQCLYLNWNTRLSNIMGKVLNDIKKDIALLTLYIKLLDPASKHSAIVHLFEESIGLLKTEHNLDKVEQNLPKEKSELLLKDDSSDKEDTWMFNNDLFGVSNISLLLIYAAKYFF